MQLSRVTATHIPSGDATIVTTNGSAEQVGEVWHIYDADGELLTTYNAKEFTIKTSGLAEEK